MLKVTRIANFIGRLGLAILVPLLLGLRMLLHIFLLLSYLSCHVLCFY